MPDADVEFPDLGNSQTILDLATGALRWPCSPWKSRKGGRSFYKPLCRDMCQRLKLSSDIVADSYGQGYSTYIDAWFYKETNDFRVLREGFSEQAYVGLWVLFHNSSPLYVFGEGEKSWRETGGASYLPTASAVDKFTSDAVRKLAERVEQYLTKNGLVRLQRSQVYQLLPPDFEMEIETNLSDGELRIFDALYWWMD